MAAGGRVDGDVKPIARRLHRDEEYGEILQRSHNCAKHCDGSLVGIETRLEKRAPDFPRCVQTFGFVQQFLAVGRDDEGDASASGARNIAQRPRGRIPG
jgi:hypothetical protein